MSSEKTETKPETGGKMTTAFALNVLIVGNFWLHDQLKAEKNCTCGHCYLCAFRFLEKQAEENEMMRHRFDLEGIDPSEPFIAPSQKLRADRLAEEVERLNNLINTPHTSDFLEAIPLEAAHQLEKWGDGQDEFKTPADFFWTLGYLSQKAMIYQMEGNAEKAKHHTITSAALLFHWFRIISERETYHPDITKLLTEKH